MFALFMHFLCFAVSSELALARQYVSYGFMGSMAKHEVHVQLELKGEKECLERCKCVVPVSSCLMHGEVEQ